MTWKNFVATGLLCLVASPAFAVPTLKVTSGGLDGSGNWVWNVTIASTTGITPVAAELGFRETTGAGQQLISATAGTPFTGANTQNPGTQIFTWETLEDVGGGNMKPVGLQTNCASGCTSSIGGGLDEVFSAIGSFADVPSTDTQYLTLVTKGPTATSLTTSGQVLGKYTTGGGAGTSGRIAEITDGGNENSVNYNNFAGTFSRTVKAGDINLSGTVDFNDLGILATHLDQPGLKNWTTGDLNGSGTTDFNDLGILATNLDQSGGSTTNLTIAGAQGGGASLDVGFGNNSVPEPTSLVVLVLGSLLACCGWRRR